MERKVDELLPEAKNWISRCLTLGLETCEFYGTSMKNSQRPSDLDIVFKKWKLDTSPEKIAPNGIINGLGILFGELMIEQFRLEWRIVTDDFGTEFALIFPGTSREIYPRDFVAKRIDPDNNEFGFFEAMQNLIKDELSRNK